MKRIISIVLVFAMIIVPTFSVSASGIDRVNASSDVIGDAYYDYVLSDYVERFAGKPDKQQEFLQAVLKKEDDGITVDTAILEEIYIDLSGITDPDLPHIINQEFFECSAISEDGIIKLSEAEKESIRINNIRITEYENDVILRRINDDNTISLDNGVINDDIIGNDFETTNYNNRFDAGSASKAPMVSAGSYHNVYLKSDGTVWTWGKYKVGGLVAAIDIYTLPTQVSGLSSVSEVAAGGAHSLALKSDGTVWAWGLNNYGQLGDNTLVDKQQPVQVCDSNDPTGKLTNVVGIAAGEYHSLAIKADGSVVAWGYNAFGQLGNNSTTTAKLPCNISSLYNIVEIAAGKYHSLAVRSDGSVWAWGSNDCGQLGDNTTSYKKIPTRVRGTTGTGYLSNIASVSAGSEHSLALSFDGSVYSWGANNSGQLGNSSYSNEMIPVKIWSSQNKKIITEIAAYGTHSLIKTWDGNVYAFGHNSYGVLGYDFVSVGPSFFSVETPILSDIASVSSLATGEQHSIAIKNDGTIWVVGDNSYFQFGTGIDGEILPSPMYMTGTIEKISSSMEQGMALKSDGTVWAWGNIYATESTEANLYVPTQIKGENGNGILSDITDISAGSRFAMALGEDGTVWTWGENFYGQLGDGTNSYRLDPARVKGEDGIGYLNNIKAISAGSSHCLVVTNDGNVLSWGQDNYSAAYEINPYPVKIAVSSNGEYLNDVISVSAGGRHSIALKSDGTVWAWGFNNYGQLGIGTTQNSFLPVQVKSSDGENFLSDIIAVSAGSEYSMAIKADGTVYAWGYNYNGQLGIGSNTNKTLPNQVKGVNNSGYLSDIIALSAGNSHVLALKNDGTVYAWGANYDGKLGDNTTTARNTPVCVKNQSGAENLSNIKDVSSGYGHSMVLTTDGIVMTWGSNSYGQLGNNIKPFSCSWIRALSPTSGAVKISVDKAYYHSLLLNSDGSVWASGDNMFGQLGNGTTSDSTTPVRVKDTDGINYLSGIVDIATGAYQSFALRNDGMVVGWGYNNGCNLGNDSSSDYFTLPVYVNQAEADVGLCLYSVVAISSGVNHCMALKADGTVWTWGQDTYEQLGYDSQNMQSSYAKQVRGEDGVGFLTDVIAISAGGNHCLALKSDGSVWAWGYNNKGQLGDNTCVTRQYPTQVRGISPTDYLWDIVAIAAGEFHSLALSADGKVYGWGDNYYSQLGNGSYSGNAPLPIRIMGENGTGYLEDIKSISAGSGISTFAGADGSVYVCGKNSNGIIGTGTVGNIPYPTELPISNMKYISGGFFNTMAIAADGSIWAWGSNSDGAFGIGSSGNVATTPVIAYTRNDNYDDSLYDDYPNHFTEAVTIQQNTVIMGEINDYSDVDFFKFTANMSGDFVLEKSSDGECLMGILNSATVNINPFLNTYRLTEGETYFIRVSNNPLPSFTGKYSYSFKISPFTGSELDGLEVNVKYFNDNYKSEAFLWGRHSLEAKIDLTNSSSASKNVDVALVLYNAQNEIADVVSQNVILAAGQEKETTLNITLPKIVEGYYMRTMIWDKNNSDFPHIVTSTSKYGTDTFGPVALNVESGERVSGRINTQSDADTFTFTPTDSLIYAVRTTGNVSAEVYTSDGTPIAQAESYSLTAGNTYKIKIFGNEGLYTFAVVPSPLTIQKTVSLTNCATGEYYDIAIKLDSISNISAKQITITYDTSVLQIYDLCTFSKTDGMAEGPISGTDFKVISISDGEIVMEINNDNDNDNDIVIGQQDTWSGTATVLRFKAKTNGSADITTKIENR